jgi:hypothetical protein
MTEHCCQDMKWAVKDGLVKKPGDRLPLSGTPTFATKYFVHMTNFIGINFYKYLIYCPFCGIELEDRTNDKAESPKNA